jgi:NAD(P)H-dependent FMN reductase
MDAPQIVAVCGSRRAESHTRKALERALEAAADAGARTDLIDLRTADVPLYDPDADDTEQGEVLTLLARVERADGVIVGSPVYHSSYASTFKNFHDYCGREEFADTVTGLLAVAGGSNYETTLEHMRATMVGVGSVVTPGQVGIGNASDAFEGGELRSEVVADRLDGLGREVVEYAQRLTVD